MEFAGTHTDPALRFGGNRISKLDVRSGDRTSQTDGLSGCRSCSPHSLLRSGKDQVHPAAHSKQIKKGIPHSLRLILTLNVDTSYTYYSERYRSLGMRIPGSGIVLLCRGSDGPVRKALNERKDFEDLCGERGRAEAAAAAAIKAALT